jgi:fumarate hydratase subunit alpha
MREIATALITDTVARLYMEASFHVRRDFLDAVKQGVDTEESPIGKEVLRELIRNYELAGTQEMPVCQDTGTPVLAVEVGQEVHIRGGGLTDAINEGVRRATKEGYLRASLVGDPLERKNTGDNTPAPIHYDIVPGDHLRIWIGPKGGGSENMGAVKLMKPADGVEGIKQFVWDTVRAAGPNPCPPLIVGVGIGGTMDQSAWNSKRAVYRFLGSTNPKPHLAQLEEELLTIVNGTGVGPAGFGGTFTAAAVHIETAPCHIASMPVAITLLCNAARYAEATI